MATAIERNFDTMRYRMYFAKIPKFSQEQIDWYTEQYQLCEEQPEIALEKNTATLYLSTMYMGNKQIVHDREIYSLCRYRPYLLFRIPNPSIVSNH